MKLILIMTLFASTIVTSASFATTIRCTSRGRIVNFEDPAFTGPTSNANFEHVFDLEEGQEVDAGEYSFDLIPGITVLIAAGKKHNNSDVQIQAVITNTTFGSRPYVSSLGLNAVNINLNDYSIPGTIDERSLPAPKFGESKIKFQERLVKAINEQPDHVLQQNFRKKFGDIASVFCRKDF